MPQRGSLPQLTLGEVSVSGISSGADLVVQLQTSYADLISGTGVFAGQAFHCAVTRFPGDNLTHESKPGVPGNWPGTPNIPACAGCPPHTSLGYDHCKHHPALPAGSSLLVDYAKAQAAAGNISSIEQLAKRRVFLYRGTVDHTYNKGSVQATADFFRAFMPDAAVFFEKDIISAHLVPTIDPYLCWWEEWAGPDNCTFDGAGHVLSWVHGKAALANGRDNRTEELKQYIHDFDQSL